MFRGALVNREPGSGRGWCSQTFSGWHPVLSCIGQDGDDLEDLKWKGKQREGLRKKAKQKEWAGSVYIGLALSRSFSWQMLLLTVGWERALQTANERWFSPVLPLPAQWAGRDGEPAGPRLTPPAAAGSSETQARCCCVCPAALCDVDWILAIFLFLLLCLSSELLFRFCTCLRPRGSGVVLLGWFWKWVCGGSYPPPGQAGCVPSSLDAPSPLLPLQTLSKSLSKTFQVFPRLFPRVSDLTQAAGGWRGREWS